MEKDDLISRFYNGDIIPMEQIPKVNTDEYNELCNRVTELENNLMETISGSQKVLLTEYKNTLTAIHEREQAECFKYAFRLGGKFVIEML